ncbi:DUF1129 domain-containing protein [Bombilactobacillus folatiphilus]|uniref:DUF1129 domain-containing protein n=1 Tax=Bombilactobacillus folatiphilus TaxID=2923362 RepID=A0ABY4P929_9LACO|nr:DUF1129 family protein [Bombilactobacillus folatiphilus]UQS82172.1 DUF1129 domain-containing protein [Bombilactobacillus folatiphilus]
MDPREKNEQKQAQSQEKTIKRQQQLATEEQIRNADATALWQKLSRKNEDYLFKLHKALQNNGKTTSQAQEIIDNLLPEVLENQVKGITARQLYGKVADKLDATLHRKVPSQTAANTPMWQMAVDNSLLFIAVFAVMYGIMSLFIKNPSRDNQSGILSILIIAIIWGVLFGWLNKRMMTKKEEREPFWKTILVIIVGLLFMMLAWLFTVLLPPVLNPILPAWAEILIAVVAYGLRWLFRRYYHITFSSFTGK